LSYDQERAKTRSRQYVCAGAVKGGD
jgi:hypothetical protein